MSKSGGRATRASLSGREKHSSGADSSGISISQCCKSFGRKLWDRRDHDGRGRFENSDRIIGIYKKNLQDLEKFAGSFFMSERSFLHMQWTLFLIERKQQRGMTERQRRTIDTFNHSEDRGERRRSMQVIEYTEFQYDEIKNLYAAVGWTVYTNDMEALRKGYAHSLKILVAIEEYRLLDIIHAVGDGSTIVWSKIS